jgi:hypothetical protein
MARSKDRDQAERTAMTPAKLVLVALVTAWGVGGVRAADGNSMELELCIKTARDADETCGKLVNDPTQRLECFKKARGTQLDCLEHALADVAPGIANSENHSPASPSDSPASTGSTDEMSRAKAEGNTQDTSQDSKSQESKAPQESAPPGAEPGSATGSAQAASEPPPPAPDPAATPAAENKTAAVQSDAAKETAKEDAPKETAKETVKETVKEPAKEPAKEIVKETAKENAKETVKETSKTDSKPNSAQVSPAESSWVVSETTSPVDYRPLLAAMIHPTSSSQDGASSLAIRCRAGRTELILRTEGTWHSARNNALPVDRQINDQAVVRQKWILAADAKTATYADDTVELLRSLPDGARLTLGVPDGANARHDATFLLAGWDAVRKRVETACKWPKATDEASSKR